MRGRSRLEWVLPVAGLVLTASVGGATGHDRLALEMMQAGDTSRADWFASLVSPSGQLCCDERDCRRTVAEWRGSTRSWWAVVRGEWRPVPNAVVLETPRSIDGEAYICVGEDSYGDTRHAMSRLKGPLPGQIFCFVPPDSGS